MLIAAVPWDVSIPVPRIDVNVETIIDVAFSPPPISNSIAIPKEPKTKSASLSNFVQAISMGVTIYTLAKIISKAITSDEKIVLTIHHMYINTVL